MIEIESSIAKRIQQAAGGEIRFDSLSNCGNSLVFLLQVLIL